MRLDDIMELPLRAALGNRVTSGVVTLAINAGSAATIKTTGTTTYQIDSRPYTKAALSAQALTANATLQAKITFQTGFYIQPISTTVYYLVLLNSAGTVTVLQGTYSGQQFTGANIPLGDGSIPDPQDLSYCAIGLIKIVTNASTTFTPATTALDAAGLTVTFYDLTGIIPVTAP